MFFVFGLCFSLVVLTKHFLAASNSHQLCTQLKNTAGDVMSVSAFENHLILSLGSFHP